MPNDVQEPQATGSSRQRRLGAPTIDFFEAQRAARSKTRLLIFLFFAAVMGTAGATGTFLALIHPILTVGMKPADWTPLETALRGGTASAAFILLVACLRLSRIAGGGRQTACLLGARELLQADFSEESIRCYRNVVDEMAIASGVPRPALFVLEEESINAFVAGFSPKDATLCVTRGCLSQLSREELQGVAAHEFSHLLSGDMRLNTIMLGLLGGLSGIGTLGRVLLGRRGGRTRGFHPQSAVVGALLCVIGYFGVLVSSLIKAAVSRPQEYRADAAAAQWTRNPEGLVGALYKVTRARRTSFLKSPFAAEVAHMCISASVSRLSEGLFATHPPLKKRIARLLPGWTEDRMKAIVRPPLQELTPARRPDHSQSHGQSQQQGEGAGPSALSGAKGSRPEALSLGLSEEASLALETDDGALAAWLVIALGADPSRRKESRSLVLESKLFGHSGQSFDQMIDWLSGVQGDALLEVAELATHALGMLSPQRLEQAKRVFFQITDQDGRISFLELMLACGMVRYGKPIREGRPGGKGYPHLRDELLLVLSAFAWAAGPDDQARDVIFMRGMGQFSKHGIRFEGKRIKEPRMRNLFLALQRLDEIKIGKKAGLLKLVAQMTEGVPDGEVMGALHRALRWSLGWPASVGLSSSPRVR